MEKELLYCSECMEETDRLINNQCPSCHTREIMANGKRKVEWEDLPENKYFAPMSKIAGYSRGLTKEEMELFATPEREPVRFHDDFEKTFSTKNTNTMHDVFSSCQLMDLERGAGELNKRKISRVIDPNIMASQMPGRNVGWTKNGRKPKCPTHHVTVTEYGTCPICDRRVVRRHTQLGGVKIMFETQRDGTLAKDQYVKARCAKLHTKENGKKQVVAELPWETEWLKDEPIGKENFTGYVNKKSDFRDPRTGSYPSPNDPERFNKNRHNSIILLDYNITQKRNNETTFVGSSNIPVRRVSPELRTCKECDCKITLKDMRRGDKVCPRCGLIKGRVMINQGKNRGGDDDVEYGGG